MKKKKEKHWHSLKRNYPESCQGTWKGSSCKISPSPEETTQWSPTHFPNELSLCCSLIIVDKNTTLQQACDEWSNTVIDAILEVPAVPEVFLLVSLCRIWVERSWHLILKLPQWYSWTSLNWIVHKLKWVSASLIILWENLSDKKSLLSFLPSIPSVCTRFCINKIPDTIFPWKYFPRNQTLNFYSCPVIPVQMFYEELNT